MHALTETGNRTPRQFFVQHGFVAKIATATAIFGRQIEAQQPHLTRLAPNFFADAVLRAPLGVVGHHLGLDETRDVLAEESQIVVHPR